MRLRGGSSKGKEANIERGHESGHFNLIREYFGPVPIYSDEQFARRFCMPRDLFLRIVERVAQRDPYFQQRRNVTGNLGLSTLQKCTAAIRILSTGSAADIIHDYVRIGESTAFKCLKRFALALIDEFGDEYLRDPTKEDIEYYMEINESRGFPGMFGSIDCTDIEWKNCPSAWTGQFQGKSSKATIAIEAVVTQDLWCWSSYIGLAGANNDINIADRSPLLMKWLKGPARSITYNIAGRSFKVSNFLADGIYTSYTIYMKAIAQPQGRHRELYTRRQEAIRKEVERFFGVLKSRFKFLSVPCRLWNIQTIASIWKVCIILSNMIVKRTRSRVDAQASDNEATQTQRSQSMVLQLDGFVRECEAIKNEANYYRLRDALIHHAELNV
ncbi:hypothetical protein Ae201684P_005130 [Aphanomyces euteiches]|nr:hypothetical protein Ae201684P_005130 [Aphanomyces euteiches]KAH9157491.1 hypothetical protein AeRB84_000648 [Aphanomyces euteiches]